MVPAAPHVSAPNAGSSSVPTCVRPAGEPEEAQVRAGEADRQGGPRPGDDPDRRGRPRDPRGEHQDHHGLGAEREQGLARRVARDEPRGAELVGGFARERQAERTRDRARRIGGELVRRGVEERPALEGRRGREHRRARELEGREQLHTRGLDEATLGHLHDPRGLTANVGEGQLLEQDRAARRGHVCDPHLVDAAVSPARGRDERGGGDARDQGEGGDRARAPDLEPDPLCFAVHARSAATHVPSRRTRRSGSAVRDRQPTVTPRRDRCRALQSLAASGGDMMASPTTPASSSA